MPQHPPIGDPRPAGQDGPAGDTRQAGEEGPAGDPRPAGVESPGQTPTDTDAPFDPADHTVADVNDYLANVDDEELDRVLTLEREGKARAGILDG